MLIKKGLQRWSITIKNRPENAFLRLAWSHHGKRIAATTQVYCGDSCGIVLEWDAYTQQHFSFNIDLPIFALAWSPDDTRLVSSIEITTQDSSITDADGPYVQIT